MRRIILMSLLVVLSGCSDVSSLLSFGDKTDDEPVVEAVTAPVAPPAPDDSFCKAVAVEEATQNDFDTETQKRVAAQSYAQCRTIFQR